MKKQQKNTSLQPRQSKKTALVMIMFSLFLMVFLIGIVDATLYIQSTGLEQTDNSIEELPFGRGANISVNSNVTLTRVTSYAGSTASSMGLYYVNKTGIVNATITSGNATFNVPLYEGQSYYLCNIGQTYSGWAVSATFPYNNDYVNFTSGGINCGNDYSVEPTLNREILSITVSTTAVSVTPSVTLDAPLNNSNQLIPIQFVITSSSSNSTFSLTNLTFFLDDVLNETISITGTTNVTTFSKSLTTDIVHNWTAYACDTFNCSLIAGNQSFSPKKLIEESQVYNIQGLEGSSQTFKLNVSLSSGYSLSAINLTYNNTNYSATFSAYNSSLYQITRTITLPFVSANTNKTFNWTILLIDTTKHYITSRDQIVVNLGFDNCTINNVTILNFTMKDERTQTTLNATGDNTSIRVDINLYSNAAKTILAGSYSHFYNQTSNNSVCISSELGTTIFYMDAQVEYTANNHQTEFYNIQSYSLNATANPVQNITLYDLLTTEAQAFKIIYRDSSFIPVANALIQIQRKYIEEGIFKTVEQPLTDTDGQTIANLVLNNVIYNFIVIKDGAVLSTFSNYFANCQNPLIQSCEISLNAFSSIEPITNFTAITDFLYTLTYDNSTRTITGTFTIPSGTVATISLNVTTTDALGKEACSSSVTTSGGSVSCVVPSTFGNSTVMANFYKDGVWVGGGQISLQQTPKQTYGSILVVLAIFIFLTLIGAGMSDNPIYTIVFFIVGVILLVALNILGKQEFIGGGATILFLIIAIIILIVKAGRRS